MRFLNPELGAFEDPRICWSVSQVSLNCNPPLVFSIVEIDAKLNALYGIFAAVITHLKSNSHSDVLIFGLWPAKRDIAKRIAAEGYSMLVANPFTAFQRSASTMTPLKASVSAAGGDEEDAIA
jgi:hypothetical protein